MRTPSALLVALAVVVATGCTDGGEPAEDVGSPTSVTVDARTEAATRAFCDKARSLENAIEIDPASPDPAEIQRTAEGLGELATLAPEAIRDQVASARRLMQEFSDLLASVDVSDPTSMSSPEFQERLAGLQEQDATMGADLEEIARFVEVECSVPSDADDAP